MVLSAFLPRTPPRQGIVKPWYCYGHRQGSTGRNGRFRSGRFRAISGAGQARKSGRSSARAAPNQARLGPLTRPRPAPKGARASPPSAAASSPVTRSGLILKRIWPDANMQELVAVGMRCSMCLMSTVLVPSSWFLGFVPSGSWLLSGLLCLWLLALCPAAWFLCLWLLGLGSSGSVPVPWFLLRLSFLLLPVPFCSFRLLSAPSAHSGYSFRSFLSGGMA